jgi:dTDP-4-amino-4,6-dideoxygalactose transaminase
MAIPFFSIDFKSKDWTSFIGGVFGLTSRSTKENFLIELLNKRFPEKKVILFPSARMAFYFVLKNTFQAGDEVIFPVMGFPLYVKIALQLNLKPKYVDVENEHLTIDVDKLEESITKYTKGIVVTHLFGYPCNMDKIMEIADKYNLPVIEDAAQSYDSFYKGKETGTFGYAGIFSCSLMKVPTTLGGGILLTKDEALFQDINADLINGHFNESIIFRLKYFIKNFLSILNSYPLLYSLFSHRVFGFIKKRNPATLRKILYSGMGLISKQYDEWERPRLSNYQLSVGNTQFNRSSEMTKLRQSYSKLLDSQLSNNNKFKLFIDSNDDIYWNCQYYVVSVKNNMNDFVDEMFKNGIHLMKEDVWDCSDYDFSRNIDGNFLVAKENNPTLVRIPNSSFLSKNDMLKIATLMNSL